MSESILHIQRDLQAAGFYDGEIDGIWGDKSKDALDAAVKAATEQRDCSIAVADVKPDFRKLAWGSRVSQAFKERVIWIANALNMPEQGADWLMACMAWESAESFTPNIRNMAGSGATGLIQFMPKTATALGTSTELLARMTAEDQLNYVYKYFRPFRGRLNNLSDVYMAILWPLGVGKPESFVLWSRANRPTTFRQNAGLDVNKDGAITKAEAASKVYDKLARGKQAFLG